MNADEVYMRFNNRKARWEPVTYTWEQAVSILGSNYDLKRVSNGMVTIRLRTPGNQ
jgi:hypothetical protein